MACLFGHARHGGGGGLHLRRRFGNRLHNAGDVTLECVGQFPHARGATGIDLALPFPLALVLRAAITRFGDLREHAVERHRQPANFIVSHVIAAQRIVIWRTASASFSRRPSGPTTRCAIQVASPKESTTSTKVIPSVLRIEKRKLAMRWPRSRSTSSLAFAQSENAATFAPARLRSTAATSTGAALSETSVSTKAVTRPLASPAASRVPAMPDRRLAPSWPR